MRERVGLAMRETDKWILGVFVVLAVVVVLQFILSSFDRDFLRGYETHLLIAAVVFGTLVFWVNRSKIVDFAAVSADNDKLEEAGRKEQFGQKFPKLDRVPGISQFSRWMYKEGWFYSVGLILLVAVGFVLRIFNADLGFWQDESFGVVTANSLWHHGRLVLTGPMMYGEDVLYYRGVPHTALMALSIGMFGLNEIAARLPGILMSCSTIVVLYLFGRDIGSKRLGLVAATLIVFWDWHIFLSTWSRFYVMTTFVFVLTAYLFYKGFIKDSLRYKIAALIMMVVCFWVSQLSVGLLVLFLFPVFYRRGSISLKYICLASIWAALAMIPLWVKDFVPLDGSTPLGSDQTSQPLRFLVQPVFLEWLVDWFPVVMMFVILAFFACVFTRDAKKLYPVMLLLILIVALVVKEMGNPQPRNLVFLAPLMALCCSIGICQFVGAIGIGSWTAGRKALGLVAVTVLLVCVAINPVRTFKVTTIDYGDELDMHNRFSSVEETYPDYKTTVEYVNEHYEEGDAIIIDSDPHQIYCEYEITAALTTSSPDLITLEDILSIIRSHHRTWITYGYIDPDKHTYDSFRDIWRFLDVNKANVVYEGGDTAKTYLFSKDSLLVIPKHE